MAAKREPQLGQLDAEIEYISSMRSLSRNRNAPTSRVRIFCHESLREIEISFLAYEVLSGLPNLQRILKIHVLTAGRQRDTVRSPAERILNSRTILLKLF